MSERKGVILLMFDLPMVTDTDRREYYHFRKNLKRNGFLQLQESCYLKLIRNIVNMESSIQILKDSMPACGNVSVLPMTLMDFKKMECIKGDPFNMPYFTDDIFVISKDEENGTDGNDITA